MATRNPEAPSQDSSRPEISVFSLPLNSTSNIVTGITFVANDNLGVTGFYVSEDPSAPAVNANVWMISAPASHTFSSNGFKTLFAWTKDSAGNISERAEANVTIALAGNKTWFIRSDGGTSAQCTGLFDAPYTGSGIEQPCAVNHPFWLFPPPAKPPLVQGGDIVVIGPGEYMMGSNATTASPEDTAPNTGLCAKNTGVFTCMMAAIPSGPDAEHPTTVIGKNAVSKSTPAPQLWGAGRVDHVLDLTGSNNVVLQYLDLTDHAECGYNFTSNPELLCNRSVAPYGYQADYAIYAKDSANVLLKDVNIHGFSNGALHAGRLTDWTFDHVTMHGNAFNGWNGDIGHGPYGSGTDSSMHGAIVFKNSKVNYNGCIEKYPVTGSYPFIPSGGCYGQGQGGYGDGLGLYFTEADWVFEDTEVMHNTQDGLDLLYHTGQTGTVRIKRSRFEGNAGQQLKVGARTEIENTIVVGNCNFFHNNPIAIEAGFPDCRAAGTPIVTTGWRKNHFVTMVNSTVVGPNKIFIEAGSGGSAGNALVTGNLTPVASAAAITAVNQYAIDSAQDAIWVRLSGSLDPNSTQVVPRKGPSDFPLSGAWVPDGANIYRLNGVGILTAGNYSFDGVFYSDVSGGSASVVTDNQYAVNQAQDTLWLRWAGSQDPNQGQVVLQWHNYGSRVTLGGTWTPHGSGIYSLSGIGAQTGGVYAFNNLIKANVCDGSEKFISRNNLFVGLEWWSTSIQAIVPGTYADTFYLNGYDGNGNGSCAATHPVQHDLRDSIVFNSKFNLCSPANNVICLDPLLGGIPPFAGYGDIYTYGERWDLTPLQASPARGKSSSLPGASVWQDVIVPGDDFLGMLRSDSSTTWGAKR